MTTKAAESSKTESKSVLATTPATPAIDTSGWNEANLSIDAWYAPDVTGVLLGRCMEAIRVTSAYGEQDVVKIRLGAAARGIQGKGDAAETVEMVVGDIIGVRVSTNLTVLLDLVENQCAVQIEPTGKKKTGSGRTILTYKVKWKGERKAATAPIARAQESSGGAKDAAGGGDDIPF